MADFNKVVSIIFKWEGGYSNAKTDKGNKVDGQWIGTNHGISAQVLKEYLGRTPTVEEMKALTKEVAMKIMKKKFWDRWKADEINNQSIANFLVDWTYNSGSYGITVPQEVLGVVADGSVGPKTIAAVNSATQHELFDKLKQTRIDYVNHLKPELKVVYLDGWMNRINDFKFCE
jgi:lysozyme family protein